VSYRLEKPLLPSPHPPLPPPFPPVPPEKLSLFILRFVEEFIVG